MSKVVRSFLKPNYEGHKPQHPFFNFLGGVQFDQFMYFNFLVEGGGESKKQPVVGITLSVIFLRVVPVNQLFTRLQ